MPELPEIEAIRVVLAKELVGKKIKSIAITNGKLVGRHKTAKEFRAHLEGHAIKGVTRLGRNLLIALDDAATLVIDPGPTGQLLRAKGPKDAKPKHTQAVFTFSQGPELRFVDANATSEMYASVKPAEGEVTVLNKFVDRLALSEDGKVMRRAIPELATLGLDPVIDQFGWDRLGIVLQVAKQPIQTVLKDQRLVAGLGDVYAAETLFTAGVRENRSSETLTSVETRRLHRALIEVISEGLKLGGTTVAPENWVDPDGKVGGYQSHLQVFGREGEPCSQCRTKIQRSVTSEYLSFYCARCQA
jgi:formamidopyrimidine-DNA glycosylase